MQVPGTALLVEDDPRVAATLRSHLMRAGFTVHEARSERDALRRVEGIAPDVVILDLALENGDAWLAEHQLELTNGERAVLIELARTYPGLTSRTVLDRRPDQERDVSSNVTEVLVARLRRKIAAAGGGVEIHAIRRSGYVLRPMTVVADVSGSIHSR